MKAKHSRENALLASPLVLFLLALLGFPTLLSIVYGFSTTTFETLSAPQFSGFTNFRDVLSDPDVLGKPIGQDIALGRPSSARELGLDGAIFHFEGLVAGAIAAIPECAGAPRLRALVRMESERLVPSRWCEDAHRRALA